MATVYMVRLNRILLTLQNCLETSETACQCGECEPCTTGQDDIRLAMEEVQDIADEYGKRGE